MNKITTWEDYSLFSNCDKSFYLRKKTEEKEMSPKGVGPQYKKEKQTLRELVIHSFYGSHKKEGKDSGFKENEEWSLEKLEDAAQKTKEYLDEGSLLIFNAVFKYEGFYAYADIASKLEGDLVLTILKPGYIEVSQGLFNLLKKGSKNGEGLKLMNDGAYLKTIVGKAGYKAKIKIGTINHYYTRGQKLDVKKLVEMNDIEPKIMSHMQIVQDNIEEIEKMIEDSEYKEPEVIVGSHCKKPTCPFYKKCWKNVGNDSIVNIQRITLKKKQKFLEDNIHTVFDIPLNHPELTDNQRVSIAKVQKGKSRGNAFIKKVRLGMLLKRLTYPLYHLDFETYSPMIPLFPNTKPYDTIPYQFSLHIEHKDGRMEHEEFLNIENEDPRPAFVSNLLQKVANTKGNVVVYNRGFEAMVMTRMGELYPDAMEGMTDIIERIFDLMEPFKNKYFFDYKMYFSYSLKMVLPALVPELTHGAMEVSDGLEAMGEYFHLMELDDEIKKLQSNKNNLEESELDHLDSLILKKEKIIQDLLKYCKLDTYAMVKILEVLIKGKADLSDWEK